MAPETFKSRPVDVPTRLFLLGAPIVLLAAMVLAPSLFAVPLDRVPMRAKVMMVLLPLFLAVAMLFVLRFRDRARLVVDDVGIRMDNGLPPWAGSAPWSIKWSEVGKVRTISAAGVVQVQKKGSLVFRPLRVHDWIRVDEPAPSARWFLRARDTRNAALWQALERHGLFAAGKGLGAGEFDLAQHPATRAALGVMALLMLYAAADFFLARERWAVLDATIFAVPGAIGLVAAVPAFLLLTNADRPTRIPSDVTGPLALVFGLAVACASFYGVLRLNQWVAPLEPHAYVRNVSCDALDPVEPGLPSIEYDVEARAYLCSLPRDRQQTVLLRRGLGGMYQVDLTEQTRAIRAFHAGRAASAAPAR